jgi:DNA-binding response OmpR family regulator
MGKDRILLVDRDEDVREMACRIAESLGFDVVSAAQREEALELLGSGPFSILLAAVGGPEANGYDLIYAARGKSPDLAILCLTAPGMASKFTDLINLGGSDYLAKPFNGEDLTA